MEDIEVYTDDIDKYIKLFCEEQEIEDLRTVSQSVFNACLMYICRHLYKNTDILKFTPNINNTYDLDKVECVCDYYIYLCGLYDKECSIVGFSNLIGISKDTIFSWSELRNNVKLSSKGSDIWQKLHDARENSLSDKLISCKGSPVGLIAALNHRFGWSSPYSAAATSDDRKRISRADLTLQDGAKSDAPQLPGDIVSTQ